MTAILDFVVLLLACTVIEFHAQQVELWFLEPALLYALQARRHMEMDELTILVC